MGKTLAIARMMLLSGFFAGLFTGIAGAFLFAFWIALSPILPVIGFVLGMFCGFATGCIGSTLGGTRGWGIAAYWSLTAYFYLLLPMNHVIAFLFVNVLGLFYAIPWMLMAKLLYSPDPFPDPNMPLANRSRMALEISPSAEWSPKTRYSVALVQAIVYGLVIYLGGHLI